MGLDVGLRGCTGEAECLAQPLYVLCSNSYLFECHAGQGHQLRWWTRGV